MTNTTDKFIDILNSSIFPIVGLETKIQKVGTTTPVVAPELKQDDTAPNNLESSSLGDASGTESNIENTAEAARQELIKARRARLNPAE
jgi:hypothetical protein